MVPFLYLAIKSSTDDTEKSSTRDLALTSIYLYISLIVTSLAFSISAIKSKKIDTSMLKNKIKLSESDENTFTVIVKDGKIVSIK